MPFATSNYLRGCILEETIPRSYLRSDRAALLQFRDVLPRIAGFEQDFLRMLPMLGRHLRLLRHRAVDRHRLPANQHLAGHRMIEFEQVSVDARLLALEHVVIIDDLGREHIGIVEFREPFLAGFGREDFVEHGLNLIAMKIARDVVAVLGVILQMFDAGNLAERRPALVVDARDADVAVLGWKRAPYAMQKLMPTARTLGLLVGNRSVIYLHSLHCDHGAVDGSVDPLCLAGAIARDYSREDSGCEAERARMIGEKNRRGQRRVIREAALRHDTAGSLRESV